MNFPFKILALGGGGTKGFLHIGALQEIESIVGNFTEHFKGIYGCSIGSILATGIAFGLNVSQIERLSKSAMTIDFVFDNFKIDTLEDSIDEKGIFDMDSFEEHILAVFDSENIDLRTKYISDAKIPLHIIASNITKGVPAIFKGNVPILAALKASCCIPILFRPQQIGNSLYIDGGSITNILMEIIPENERDMSLAISLIHSNPEISPHTVSSMTPTDYIYKLYKINCLYEHSKYKHPNSVGLYYANNTTGIATPSDEEKDEMILAGRAIIKGFLLAKCRN